MKKKETIEVLNSLITINNDRIEGYETASKETDEQYLKILFGQFTTTSRKCKQELINEINNLGGEVAQGTLTSGKFFRVWMDVKAALTDKDHKTILNSCEYGEEVAVDTYEKVLKNDLSHLSSRQQSIISEQHQLIKSDQDKIKSMREILEEA